MRLVYAGICACVLVLSGAFAAPFVPPGVKLAVKVAPVVQVNVARPMVEATLTLTNSALTDAELSVRNTCLIGQWQVVDARKVRVSGTGGCPATIDPQYHTIAGGESFSETLSLSLVGRELRENETYVLKYRYWDVPVETKFKIKLVK